MDYKELPALLPRQVAGNWNDKSDGGEVSNITDPPPRNHAFTLPQRMNCLPPLPPQQANVNENKSALDTSEDDEEPDFGHGINDDNEFITDSPFLNPAIDGHVRQVNTNLIHHTKFVDKEIQSEYFRSKTAISLEPIEKITNNDIVLSNRLTERSPHFGIYEEGRQVWVTLNQGTDEMSKILMKRLLLKMIDEMRCSKDGITRRLVKIHKTMVPMNG